jgi:hypothetical protein
MAKASEVLEMLIPTGGWVISGDDFDSIRYDDGVKPITKKQFDDGFAQVDAWKAEKDGQKAAAKTELLTRLGITAEEAALLLS